MQNKDMTNYEIWEMLKNKMEKNYFVPLTEKEKLNCYNRKLYVYDDVINMVSLAYRSGYERAMKGRPFKIGEKKKKGGHWEPVDVKEIPKAGYKIINNGIDWGYEYIGTYKKGNDGRFYQWVEGNE